MTSNFPLSQIQNYSYSQETTDQNDFISYKIPKTNNQNSASLQSTAEKVSPKKKKRENLHRHVLVRDYESSRAMRSLFDNNVNNNNSGSQDEFSDWSWVCSKSSNSANNIQQTGFQQSVTEQVEIEPTQTALPSSMQIIATPSSSSHLATQSTDSIFEVFSSAVFSSDQQVIQHCIQQAKYQFLHISQLLNRLNINNIFTSSLKQILSNFEVISQNKEVFAATNQYEYAQLYTYSYFSLLQQKTPNIEYVSKKQTGLSKSILLDRIDKTIFIFFKRKGETKECGSSKIVTDIIKVGCDGTVDSTYVQIRNLPNRTITKQEIEYLKMFSGVSHYIEYTSKHGPRQSFIQKKADGNLSLFEATDKKPVLTLDQIENILKQLVKQLFLFHARGICHGDLKLENILYHKNNLECWITDFGAAFNTDMGELPVIRDVSSYGTPRYTAPEILCSPRELNNLKARDIYALGIILYELLIGEAPWMSHIVTHMRYYPHLETSEHLSEAMRQQATILSEYDWLLQKQAKGWIPTQRERLHFIMMSLLHFDPNKRIDAKALLSMLTTGNNSQ